MIFIFRRLTSLSFMALYAVSIVAVMLSSSCSGNDSAREYVESHGFSYPSDISGVSLLSIKYSGVGDDELEVSGAREFIQEGLASIKAHFHKKDFDKYTPYIDAIIVSSPVLFRGESEEVGLMVKVTAYGAGKPGNNMKLPVEWIGKDKQLWKTENFAYFNRQGLDTWRHAGWVY